ncbi:membrane protein [Photobacterium aquae]|uniref:Membrane protein n=1 Tax=Photobacterium aquae TaxID=1195763 RepID=A0A0J1GWV2_9GAMM|nr:DoxX family protein [Photobacterium aquae]KLV04091.1 membrane protein [Photobacterium aquae]
MYPVFKILLSAFFLFASSIKLLGWQKYIFQTQLAFFHKYGLNRRHMFAVGVIECASAVALWLPIKYVPFLGAGALALTSIGAMFFHFRFDRFQDAIPSIVTLVISILVGQHLFDVTWLS